jgi:acetyl esterase/lipase
MHHWTSIKDVAWVGDDLLSGPIRGILFRFHGLGGTGMYECGDEDRLHASKGLLTIYPYYGPWCWMNREARALVDAIAEETYTQYCLAADVPIILYGDSMGGGNALLYARYAHRPVAGVFANCPACDYTYHFRERPDVPRTIYHAYGHYEGDWDAILREHSPLHQIEHMPNVPYFIIQGEEDQAVNKACHGDPMVHAMRDRGLSVTYHEVPGMGHCWPMPEAVVQAGREFIWSLVP